MTTQNNETTRNKPVHKIRDGALCVNIWRNEFTDNQTGEVRTFYTMDMKRSYKRDEDWKETTSINADDGLRVSNLFNRAHNWVMDRKYSQSQTPNNDTQETSNQQEG